MQRRSFHGGSRRTSPSHHRSPGNPSAETSNSPPITIGRTNPPVLQGPSQMPTGTIRPDGSPRTDYVPMLPTVTDWVVSETTSPVDYSPLVTALIRSTSQVKDAPNTLTIRCRGQARTDGAWGHDARERTSCLLSDQRPARGWVAMDLSLEWKDRYLQRQSSWTSAVITRRRTLQDQRDGQSRIVSPSHVPARWMGRHP